jgi:hypothetical protein
MTTNDTKRTPRPGPDSEAFPGERSPEEQISGSQTGTIGGGGGAHPRSPNRAPGVDDESVTTNPPVHDERRSE